MAICQAGKEQLANNSFIDWPRSSLTFARPACPTLYIISKGQKFPQIQVQKSRNLLQKQAKTESIYLLVSLSFSNPSIQKYKTNNFVQWNSRLFCLTKMQHHPTNQPTNQPTNHTSTTQTNNKIIRP